MATEELMEQWEGECMDMEQELTIFELTLLFKVAINKDESPFMPVAFPWGDMPLWQAPIYLPETQALMLAQQRRLMRFGFLEIHQEAPEMEQFFRLTEKGCVAVSWWMGMLEDMGFKHETLKPRL